MGDGPNIPSKAAAAAALFMLGAAADMFSPDLLGGTGLGTTVATTAVGWLGGAAAGAGGGALWEAIRDQDAAIRERVDPESQLDNHDLQILAGRAIAVVLDAAAKDDDCPGGRRGRAYLRRAAKEFRRTWHKAEVDDRYEEVLDPDLHRFLGRADGTETPGTALTADLWEQLVGALAGIEVDGDQQAAVRFAATRLHAGFPSALYEMAKADAAKDGKASAAIQLRLMRDTMAAIGTLLGKQDEAIEQNKEILAGLEQIRAVITQQAEACAAANPAAIVGPIKTEIDELSSELATHIGGLYLSLTGLHIKVDVNAVVTAEIKTDTSAIKDDTAEIKTDTSAIKDDTAEMKAMLAELLRQRPTVAERVAAPPAPVRTAALGVTNIPAPEAHWIHRESITRAIHEMLSSSVGTASLTAAVATAAGGYGKTFAARLYAYEHAGDYPGGRFEIMVEKGDFESQLGLLLEELSPGSTMPIREAAPVVRDMLSKGPASLLIVDNVKSAEDWAAFVASGLVPGGACRVLLTTREEGVLPGRSVPVPRFTTEEAWTILARVRPDALETPNVKPVGCVLRAADGLGVAIGAVAARMRATPDTTWSAYWTHLKTAHPRLFAEDALPALFRDADAEPDADQTARHHALLDDCYDHLPPWEQRVLDYAALLPQDLAPRPWLETLIEQDAVRPPETAGAQIVADLKVARVLVPAGEEGKLLSLHRLWHGRLNERAPAHDENRDQDRDGLMSAVADCAAARRSIIVGKRADGTDRGVDDPAAITDPSLRWELPPLAALCVRLWEDGHPGHAARLGVWLGYVLKHLGLYADAAACLAPIAKHGDAVTAAIGHDGHAACFSDLAMIQQGQGDLPAARGSMERAIEINSKHFEPDHPTMAIRLSNLAMIQQVQGDLPAARGSMERAIEIISKHFEPDHPTMAISHSNLAGIQQDLGDLPAARDSMARAVEINSKHFEPDHPIMATSHSNLALIQKDQGDLPAARDSMERAIEINSKHFEPDHPTMAISHSNLALIQNDQGDLPAARDSMERAIEIHSKHFGPDHPLLGTFHSNLASILQDLGDLPAARNTMARAIEIESKHFAPDHPTMAARLNNLAHICYAEGDRAAACANLRAALAILLKHFDEDHPHVKTVRKSMRIAGCDG